MFSGLQETLASLYEGRMTVIEYIPQRDEETGITKQTEVVVLTDVPCRLSYMDQAVGAAGDAVTENIQKIKVFFSPQITIKPGSKLVIRQHGTEAAYQSSGVQKNYCGHAEVNLEYFKRWA